MTEQLRKMIVYNLVARIMFEIKVQSEYFIEIEIDSEGRPKKNGDVSRV